MINDSAKLLKSFTFKSLTGEMESALRLSVKWKKNH